MLAFAVQHGGAHRVGQAVDHPGQFGHHAVAERIAFLRTRQADDGNRNGVDAK